MNIKTIVAAAALAAAAAPSFALTLGNAAGGAGSSLFLNVIEAQTSSTSYAFDLDLTVATFDGAGSYSWNLSGDTWNTFLAGADTGYLSWAVVGNKFANNGTQVVYATATEGTVDTDLATRNIYVVNAVNDLTGYEMAINDNLDATGKAAMGDINSPVYWNYSESDTLNGKLGDATVTNAIGTAANFYSIAVTPKTPGGLTYTNVTPATVAAYTGQFMLSESNGVYTLTYSQPAAVPEPGTAALALAGLGLVGLMARRRRA